MGAQSEASLIGFDGEENYAAIDYEGEQDNNEHGIWLYKGCKSIKSQLLFFDRSGHFFLMLA